MNYFLALRLRWLLLYSSLFIMTVSSSVGMAAISISRDEIFIEKQKQSSELKIFTITADASGFMCPMLTPIFIRELEKKGAVEISKNDQLVIQAKFPMDNTITEDEIKLIAEKVGYEKHKIHVVQN